MVIEELELTALEPTLNQGQQEAAEGFQQFLFSKDKELILSGPAGTGKTYTMGHFISHVMPEYLKTCSIMGIEPEYDSVVMTATTNKAAEVLSRATGRPTETIHSFLRLRIKEDYSDGSCKLIKRQDWTVHTRLIVFIDEAFMIDSPLLALIREGTHGCKIVYIGDHCQLAPVMETASPIQRMDAPFYELTQLVRNAGQPALMKITEQLRQSVETGEFWPIQIKPGVIDHADDEQMQEALATVFHDQNRTARILAYTNQRVQAYNDHIRDMRQLPGEYGRGEFLINNNAIELGKRMLSVEEEVEIIDQDEKTKFKAVEKGVELEYRSTLLRNSLGTYFPNVSVPVDRDHYQALLKFYAKRKNWVNVFHLKKNYPDLRPREAATVHKAQGSTYDTVFIDLEDISRCHQPQTAARLLYVAFSRAKSRIILYGKLGSKYGGLVE